MPGAKGADVATDAQGSVLLDSEGDEHARIQRRDLLTGSLISQTAAILSVTKPVIGGILYGSAWPSHYGGMAAPFFRLNARPPRSQQVTRPVQQYTNAVLANVIACILWIRQPYGGPQRN